jgi:hypothetical protein
LRRGAEERGESEGKNGSMLASGSKKKARKEQGATSTYGYASVLPESEIAGYDHDRAMRVAKNLLGRGAEKHALEPRYTATSQND